MLRVLQPFQRVGGQGGGGVEATADDQPEVAEDLQLRCGLTVDAHLEQAVDDAWPRVRADLDHVVDHVEPHLPVHRGDALDVGECSGV